jgi:hypothetical protein
VNLDPVIEAEAYTRRLEELISYDGAGTIAARLGRAPLTVLAITSNAKELYPCQFKLSGNKQDYAPKLRHKANSVVAPCWPRGALGRL